MAGEVKRLNDLSGKVALVTGGGSGLGREFCDVLAEYGAVVVCADFYLERAEETCRIIEKYGHRTLAIKVDVSLYEQVKSIFQQLEDEFGRLDILVNNAGIAPPSVLIHETDVEDWRRVIDVDLNGVFYCMKEGLGIMARQKTGVVINIASVLGVGAIEPAILAQCPYTAAKHGVIGLTKQAAAEYGQFGVRVNCIAPGFYKGTRLPESLKIKPTAAQAAERAKLILSRTPLGRTAEVSELKGLLLYLASENSSFITGAVIVSDGGMTVW
jgi:NAD(P)-dependent dehydrogenase (short-subunit alcohol dehydrogenase family)